jgi:hypothetical protein
MKDDEIKLLDHFALEAMKALLADSNLREADHSYWKEVARDSYGYALAMVKERKRFVAPEPAEFHTRLPFSYDIFQRPDELGGGWRLRLWVNGEEAGGGVFPLRNDPEVDPKELNHEAYADAKAAGDAWYASRDIGE